MTRPTLHAYLVRCAGLEFIAMASSAGMACIDAMELHGVHAATAAPITTVVLA
ncbi:hypothetical protein LJR074_002576 [Acidovorax sp. LjRoot74]|uniref:hypothetical protein n=1 Tax=Acidovorax sp. LjRoot74 TaxID=3342337 RepID=UPI003ECC1FDF